MSTSADPTFESRALQLFRDLLALAPEARDAALGDCEPPLRARVQALLARLSEDDLAAEGEFSPAGTRLGAYVLEERIGRGGMGEVYRARRVDGAFDRDVAIKRIWGGHAPLAARFLRERQLLARLQHPHIAQLLDGGLDDAGRPWLAMELVRGQDLLQWCDSRCAPLTRRVELLLQVCAAVDHAHRQLVVHRDLKPSNVIVDADGTARLLDFGIARLLDDVPGEATQLQAMTPAWATPEQQSGGAVTTASDVFQLGLLARLLLSGLPRGDGQRMSHGIAQLRQRAPEQARARAAERGLAPDALQRQLRGDLDCIVARATQPDVDDRYPSALALADDLRQWLRGRPVAARAHERGYQLRRAVRRWWPALAASVAALAFLGYHVHSLGTALERTDAARMQARAATQRALRERDNARFVTDQLVAMFAAPGPQGARADQLSARDMLDNASRAFAAASAGGAQPAAATALVWDALSRIHGGMGDDLRALAMQDRAVEAARKAGDPELLAASLRTRAWVYYRLDRPRDALASATQGQRALAQQGDTHSALYARLENAAGFAALASGDMGAGWQALDRSIDRFAALGAEAGGLHLGALMNATEAALSFGQPKRAARWLDAADAMAAAQGEIDPVTALQLRMRRARLERMQDRLPGAVTHTREGLDAAVRYFGAAHPESVGYAVETAKALLAADRPADAVTLLKVTLPASAALPSSLMLPHDLRGLLGIARLLAGDASGAERDLAAVQAWRAGDARRMAGSGAALESIALARIRCGHTGVQPEGLSGDAAEPWQRRLVARWARDCAPLPGVIGARAGDAP